MLHLSLLRRLHPCSATQPFIKNIKFRTLTLFRRPGDVSTSVHQRTMSSGFKRSFLVNTDVKMQCKPLQPLYSHSLSTSAPNHSEAGELVYTGSLTKSIIGVKLFSYTSSGTSLFLMPYVLFQSSLATQNLALQASFITVISLFTFATPVLLHLLTTGYVTQLYHHAEQDSYTAVTYNFFLMKRRTVFKQAEVRVPDVTGMFTTFYAGRKGLLVNPDLFQLPSDYNHLMGYDRPFTFSEEDMERPDKV